MYYCYEWIYGIPFKDLNEDSVANQLSESTQDEWWDFWQGYLQDNAPYSGDCDQTTWFGVNDLGKWDAMSEPEPKPIVTEELVEKYKTILEESQKEFPLFWKEFEEKFPQFFVPRVFMLTSTS